MAILYVGSSAADLGGAAEAHTGTEARDANLTPVAAKIVEDADEIGKSFTIKFDPGAATTIWLHFLHHTNANVSYSAFADGYWYKAFRGNTEVFDIDVNNDNYFLEGGGQSIQVARPSPGQDFTFDVKIVCDGTNVTITQYVNGIEEASITYASSIGVPDRFQFEHYDMVWNTSAKSWYYSEFIITDNEPTLGWRLASLAPNTQGFHTAWGGDVNSILNGMDGNKLVSDTIGQKESWTLTAYNGPATSTGVRAVVNSFLASQGGGGAGPTQIAPFVRIGGTDYPQTAYAPEGRNFVTLDNNPQTAAVWDTADLATLEVGVESA